MKYSNIYDMHTHSDNSFDGNHSCVLICEGAVRAGAKGIAITDHLDIDDKSYNVRHFVTNQFVHTTRVKSAFRDTLEVFRGIELGQGIYRKELSEQILKEMNYDFVLGAMHNLEDMQDFYFLEYDNETVDELLMKYFEDVLKLAEWDKTDSIAHLTYPLRYICGKYKMNIDMAQFDEITDTIFETIIKNNKALELNVSSINKYHCDTMPNKKYIRRFKELGGKYVTVGSDAHFYDRVCENIDLGYDILKECGFDSFTVFRKREPSLIPIE